MRRAFRAFVRYLLRLLFGLFSQLEVRGLENLPAGGPLVVIINHLGHLDPPLVLAVLPWPVEPIALSDLYNVPVTGQLIRLYGAIPVHRGQFDREVIRRAIRVLEDGKVLLLAPEARMSLSGALERARPGAAYLALRCGAPLLPIAITGTETALSELRRLRRPTLTLTIGQPFALPRVELKGSHRRERLEAATETMMSRIAELLPQEYRGVYS